MTSPLVEDTEDILLSNSCQLRATAGDCFSSSVNVINLNDLLSINLSPCTSKYTLSVITRSAYLEIKSKFGFAAPPLVEDTDNILLSNSCQLHVNSMQQQETVSPPQ